MRTGHKLSACHKYCSSHPSNAIEYMILLASVLQASVEAKPLPSCRLAASFAGQRVRLTFGKSWVWVKNRVTPKWVALIKARAHGVAR